MKKKYLIEFKKQGDRGDMRKIHVTRQFFEASDPQGHFFEKTKNPFFKYGLGECVYRISGLYLFSLWPKCAVQTERHTNRTTYLQVKIGISSTGCSPHVDFDYLNGKTIQYCNLG